MIAIILISIEQQLIWHDHDTILGYLLGSYSMISDTVLNITYLKDH